MSDKGVSTTIQVLDMPLQSCPDPTIPQDEVRTAGLEHKGIADSGQCIEA